MYVKIKFMKQENKAIAFFEVFSFYLITGAACLVLGVSLTSLMDHYEVTVQKVAALSAAFAAGRFAAVFLFGYLTDRIGPRIVYFIGVVLELCYFFMIPLLPYYTVGLIAAFLGGAGMSAQDTTNPLILSAFFPDKYPSMMSIGQAFFGAGCLLPSVIRSVFLPLGISFRWIFYVFGLLAVLMVILYPFFRFPDLSSAKLAEEGGHARTGAYLTAFIPGMIAIVLSCAAYCATTNTIGLYTSAFAETLPISASLGANLITLYNIGGMAGSLINAALLRKIRPVQVLCMTSFIALGMLGIMMAVKEPAVYFAGRLVMGLCLGALYSVFVVLATGIFPTHAGLAAAGVAVTSAVADAAAPLITGKLVQDLGINASFYAEAVLLILTVGGAVVFALLYREKKQSPEVSE